jgi:hypothetical protein
MRGAIGGGMGSHQGGRRGYAGGRHSACDDEVLPLVEIAHQLGIISVGLRYLHSSSSSSRTQGCLTNVRMRH